MAIRRRSYWSVVSVGPAVPAQDAILCDEIAEYFSFPAVQPPGEDRQHQLQHRRVHHGGNLYHGLRLRAPFGRRSTVGHYAPRGAADEARIFESHQCEGQGALTYAILRASRERAGALQLTPWHALTFTGAAVPRAMYTSVHSVVRNAVRRLSVRVYTLVSP